jgi:hypothetical protein
MTAAAGRAPTRRRWPLVAALVVGIGLVLAPAVFQMFTRAPQGRDMIDAFRPYMNEPTIVGFQDDMATIGSAADELPALRAELRSEGLTDAQIDTRFPLLASFEEQWPAVDADMGDMLATMRADIVDYEAVDALPPFDLFPWFFVIPGVLVAGAAGLGLARVRRGRSSLPEVFALVVLGAGVALAPVAFQMFDRAPKGGDMVEDFRPLMVEAKVRQIQGYFVVLGGGEGTVRSQVVPALAAASGETNEEVLAHYPALAEWGETWPATSAQMAPMIGAMADNLGTYAAVKALPPFPLFPWFFVVPGVLVVVFAGLAWRDRRAPDPVAVTVPQPPSGDTP